MTHGQPLCACSGLCLLKSGPTCVWLLFCAVPSCPRWLEVGTQRGCWRTGMCEGVRGRGNPTPCALTTEKLLCHTQALPGAWVKGQSAGGCRNNSGFPSNPKFWLRVWEPSEVCAAVLQRPRVRTSDWAGRARAPAGDDHSAWSPACTPGQDYPAVGLHLWKVTPRPAAPAQGRGSGAGPVEA